MPEFIAETCLPSCMANHGNSSQVETFFPFLFPLLVFLPPLTTEALQELTVWLKPHNSPLVTEMFRLSSAWFLCMSSHLSAVVRTQLMMSFLCFFHTPSLSPVLLLLHLLSAPFLLSYLKLSGCLSGVPPPSGSWECSQGALAWHCVHDT